MRISDVEARVLRLADQVRKGTPVEDSRVELKAEWPSAEYKTARQLGGHANAARLEPVLWAIGLDERRHSVRSVPAEEISSWWSAIQKHFNGLPPELLHAVNVPVGDAVVVGLLFDTARAPFVVTTPDGSPFDREVPWREGNATRSAKREDLLRVLVPALSAPRVELLQGRVFLNEQPALKTATWSLDLRFYITPGTTDAQYVPFHTLTAAIRLPQGEIPIEQQLRIAPIRAVGGVTNISSTISELVMKAPGLAQLTGQATTSKGMVGSGDELAFAASFRTTDAHEVRLTGKLLASSTPPQPGVPTAVWTAEGSRPLTDLPG